MIRKPVVAGLGVVVVIGIATALTLLLSSGSTSSSTGNSAAATGAATSPAASASRVAVLDASVNGVEWTETLQGAVTGHWAIAEGDILYSSFTSSGTEVLDDNGAYNNSGPLQGLPGAVPYQCSGNTLRASFPTGGSDLLTRVKS
jgi:hypothetical protein